MRGLPKVAELLLHRVRMRRYYRHVFRTPAGEVVLKDLAQFCGADADLFDPDPRREAYDLGKRRVLLRIMGWLNMTFEDIEALSKAGGEEEEEDE